MCAEGMCGSSLPTHGARVKIELAQATWEGGYGHEMGDSRRKNVPLEPSVEKEACRQP